MLKRPATTTHASGEAAEPHTNLTGRREAFRRLHETGCFVIPNPWDVGSARYLQHLGFAALATTSAGFAFSQALPDSEAALSRDGNLRHIAEIAAAVDVPVSADFASGYGTSPEEVADSVSRCISTGLRAFPLKIRAAIHRRHFTTCRLPWSGSEPRVRRSTARVRTSS